MKSLSAALFLVALLCCTPAAGQSYYGSGPCSLALIYPQVTYQLSSETCTWHKMSCGIVCPYEVDMVEPVTMTTADPPLPYEVFLESYAISFVYVRDAESNVIQDWRVTRSGSWRFTVSNEIFQGDFE